MAAKAAKVKRRLDKIDTSPDWRAAGWLLERDIDSREDFVPPNSSRGMTGNTFNVLGHVNLGFDRLDDHQRIPEVGQLPVTPVIGRDSHESEGHSG
jgi:hypothetical protein